MATVTRGVRYISVLDQQSARAAESPYSGSPIAAKLFAVLGAFTSPTPARALSLTDIALRAGVPISTAHRIVAELVRWEALSRKSDGRYCVGLRLWEIGMLTPAAQILRSAAVPFMEDLHRTTNQEVTLWLIDGEEIVCLETLAGHEGTRSSRRAGQRIPALFASAGRLLMAYGDEGVHRIDRNDNALESESHFHIEDERLRKIFAEIRLEGVARSYDEYSELGPTATVSAPLRNRSGVVLGAICVGVPITSPRIHDDLIRVASRGVSSALGFVGKSARKNSIA